MKIKNLMQKEIDDICDKHQCCLSCPFYSYDSWFCLALAKNLWGDLEINYERTKTN